MLLLIAAALHVLCSTLLLGLNASALSFTATNLLVLLCMVGSIVIMAVSRLSFPVMKPSALTMLPSIVVPRL